VLLAFAVIFSTARGVWLAGIAGGAARGPGEWATIVGACTGIVTFLLAGLTQYSFGDAEVVIGMWLTTAVLMRCTEAA
jgi:hypothetical protein